MWYKMDNIDIKKIKTHSTEKSNRWCITNMSSIVVFVCFINNPAVFWFRIHCDSLNELISINCNFDILGKKKCVG